MAFSVALLALVMGFGSGFGLAWMRVVAGFMGGFTWFGWGGHGGEVGIV